MEARWASRGGIISSASRISPELAEGRDVQYAIDAGDDVFAPDLPHLLGRACRIGRRRERLADATLKIYAPRLEARLDELMARSPPNAAGLVLAQRAVDGKSNEITAPELVEGPELLDMLDLDAAIVSIDAMGTQKAIAAKIVAKGADYVLALKGNQSSLHEDAKLFFADPVLAATCAQASEIDAGHGRIEERLCRAADAGWLAERHPAWKGLRSIAAITARRIDKKSGAESLETRFYITSLAPEPKAILDAVHAHWGIENNLHWTLDVIFDEDRCNPSASSGPQG
jgi:predicted transposase YbfD/YdcC